MQLGDVVATIVSTYTHAFVEADAVPRESAADAIEAARVAAGGRQLYLGLEAAASDEAADLASRERADARTRTGDSFITSVDQESLPGVRSRAKPHCSNESPPPRWRPKTWNDKSVDPA